MTDIIFTQDATLYTEMQYLNQQMKYGGNINWIMGKYTVYSLIHVKISFYY